MPAVAKSSSNISKLGDLSTFSVSAAAIPHDTADSAGSVPNFNATFANGTDTEYLVGESLTVKHPAIGSYTGDIVSYSKQKKSAQYSLSAESILARLNSDLRAYPLSDYANVGIEYTVMPLYSLEYWTQQCGIFYTAAPGDVLFYQSFYGHFGAFAKNIVRPIRAKRYTPSSGGVAGGVPSYGNRPYVGMGKAFTMIADFPAPVGSKTGSYLPVRVPTDSTLTFGVDVRLTGAGNSGDISWTMLDGYGNTHKLNLNASADSGFTLTLTANGGTASTLLSAAVPNQAMYSVFFGLRKTATNTASVTMRVINEAGSVVSDKATTISTLLTGPQNLSTIRYYGNMGGLGDEISIANSFIALTDSVPSKLLNTQKSLTPGYKGSPFMVGFSGNVWEHIKQFCSIYHLDVSYREGKLTIGPRQKDVKVGASLSELTTSITNRESARHVEVVNQNHRATSVTPQVLWSADSVYQVNVGEVQEFTVQTKHSILETSQPVCVSGIDPYPYKSGAGQYVVTGSDGYIVSPKFWQDQGGKITTDTTDVEGEIKITIKGPDFDSPRAPYRISEGDAGRPALYVTGQGVLATPETLKIPTGNSRAAKDVGTTLDSPFIGNRKLAYDAGARAAEVFAAPEVGVSIAEPLTYDETSKLGTYPAGMLVKHHGNTFRVTTATQGPRLLSGETKQHDTIYQVSRSFGDNATIGEQKAVYGEKTIGQVNIKPMRTVPAVPPTIIVPATIQVAKVSVSNT